MTNPMEVDRISDETGAYREEALYYLEAYDWNLAPAMEACGVKTLPSVKVKSSPVVSVTEQSTAEEYSATPLTIIPPRVSNQDPRSINYPSLTSNPLPPRKRSHSGRVLNPPQELSHELKQERINLFLAVASDLPSQEVLSYLERFNWDVERAGAQYYEDRDQQRTSYDRTEIDQSYLQRFQEGYTPMIGVSNLEGFSQNETSTMDLMQHSAPPLPSLHLPSESQFHDSVGYQLGDHSSSFSGLMNVDVDEFGDLDDIPIMSSSSQVQVLIFSFSALYLSSGLLCFLKIVFTKKGTNSMLIDAHRSFVFDDEGTLEKTRIQGSSSSAQNLEDHPPPNNIDRICTETGVSRGEAVYYLESFDGDLASAIEACRSKNLPTLKVRSSPVVSVNEISAVPEWESPTERPLVMNSCPISNELQIQPEQLPLNKEEIIKQFCEIVGLHPDVAVAYLERCQWSLQVAIDYFMNEAYFTEDVTSNPPLPLIGLPSQSQFQASGSSFSSLTNIDPTDFTVANLPMASSQVDQPRYISLDGLSLDVAFFVVEEDLSTETFLDPQAIQGWTSVGHEAAPTTITLTIYLDDGGSVTPVYIPFRSDQTVRDIRNAIDELTPANNRYYDLRSVGGEDDCRDMNATVGKICKSGSTTLHQVFHNT
ncbi:UBA-like superfamily [Arabidopsis thaliana x Arabidopsis arenosa]|uniref:Uncharacterized protein n=2 Tax=Arabidopsis TaxID=3701 RepID=A0A178VR76_ARATH|nr:UBA-like superfamily [Arabidopsis thaliana x Arabidopsis arenosa]OAP08304.1 hypothetical protein AXX17_AT2G29440 [Arabidopsis thaliana]